MVNSKALIGIFSQTAAGQLIADFGSTLSFLPYYSCHRQGQCSPRSRWRSRRRRADMSAPGARPAVVQAAVKTASCQLPQKARGQRRRPLAGRADLAGRGRGRARTRAGQRPRRRGCHCPCCGPAARVAATALEPAAPAAAAAPAAVAAHVAAAATGGVPSGRGTYLSAHGHCCPDHH